MTFRIISVIWAAAVVTACGGGGGSQMAGIDGGGSPFTPPVVTAVVSRGTISGFGSVIVNEVRFDVSGASITIDGVPGIEADLEVGQVVTIRGTLDDSGSTGTAASLSFDDAVEGPISAIDPIAGTLTVLGQTVLVDAGTSFDGALSLAVLTIGDVVEVTGFVRSDGSISATRIEQKPLGGEFEVTGTASNVSATMFEINNLVVDYSAAMLNDFPSGAPQNGQLVEAKGLALGGSGELLATRVEFKGNDFTGDDGDRIEVEGFITRFVSATDFDVEGLPITTNAQTVFEFGTSADLALNRKIEVEGNIDASGLLTAERIELKQAGFIRIESIVEDVQSDQLTLLGIPVAVDVSTRIEDKSSAEVGPFNLADINVGDYVELRGFEASGGVVATRVEREDFDGEVALRGFVESVTNPNLSILGVTIQTNGATEFRDINDQLITPTTFFGQAQGRLVEVDGTLSNGTIIADEVELEN